MTSVTNSSIPSNMVSMQKFSICKTQYQLFRRLRDYMQHGDLFLWKLQNKRPYWYKLSLEEEFQALENPTQFFVSVYEKSIPAHTR